MSDSTRAINTWQDLVQSALLTAVLELRNQEDVYVVKSRL